MSDAINTFVWDLCFHPGGQETVHFTVHPSMLAVFVKVSQTLGKLTFVCWSVDVLPLVKVYDHEPCKTMICVSVTCSAQV